MIISLDEAQKGLIDLVHRLQPGEIVTLTENDNPVAQIIPIKPLAFPQCSPRPRPPVTGVPKAGGIPNLVVPDDFKEPLDEMREYIV